MINSEEKVKKENVTKDTVKYKSNPLQVGFPSFLQVCLSSSTLRWQKFRRNVRHCTNRSERWQCHLRGKTYSSSLQMASWRWRGTIHCFMLSQATVLVTGDKVLLLVTTGSVGWQGTIRCFLLSQVVLVTRNNALLLVITGSVGWQGTIHCFLLSRAAALVTRDNALLLVITGTGSVGWWGTRPTENRSLTGGPALTRWA